MDYAGTRALPHEAQDQVSQLNSRTRSSLQQVLNEISCKSLIFQQLRKQAQLPQPALVAALLQSWGAEFKMATQLTVSRLSRMFDQLSRRLANKRAFKSNWSSLQTELMLTLLLIGAARSFDLGSNLPSQPPQQLFDEVASVIPGRTSEDCYFRFLSLRKSSVREHPWSREQEKVLSELVERPDDTDWTGVGKQVFRRTGGPVLRSGKQCREHFWCYLKPGLKKSKWSEQEDNTLIRLFSQMGSHWYQMTKFLPGRNQNTIKNRFSLLCKLDPEIARLHQDSPALSRKVSFEEDLEEEVQPPAPRHVSLSCLLSDFNSFSLSLREGTTLHLLTETSLAGLFISNSMPLLCDFTFPVPLLPKSMT